MSLDKKSMLYGAAITLLGVYGCASTNVYKYYGLTLPDTCYGQGMLLGKLGAGGWADLPFTECQPDPSIKGKCVVEQASEHFAKELALEQCQSDLKNCQEGL